MNLKALTESYKAKVKYFEHGCDEADQLTSPPQVHESEKKITTSKKTCSL